MWSIILPTLGSAALGEGAKIFLNRILYTRNHRVIRYGKIIIRIGNIFYIICINLALVATLCCNYSADLEAMSFPVPSALLLLRARTGGHFQFSGCHNCYLISLL